MNKIGNAAHAETIANFDTYEDCEDAPEGFKFLGSGCYRNAYLGPDGVVYKREHTADDAVCNRGEVKMYEEHKDNPTFEGFRLAACTLYGEVLAMEFVKDNWESMLPHPCQPKMTRTMMDTFGYYDSNANRRGSNWFIQDDVIVLTDYSYGWE